MCSEGGFMQYKDHEGNTYQYMKDMCEHWNIEPETYSRRVKVYGWSVEQALTAPVKPNGGIRCRDHEGRFFRTETKMCRYWQIERKTFQYRMKHGWTLEQALTTPAGMKPSESLSHILDLG